MLSWLLIINCISWSLSGLLSFLKVSSLLSHPCVRRRAASKLLTLCSTQGIICVYFHGPAGMGSTPISSTTL